MPSLQCPAEFIAAEIAADGCTVHYSLNGVDNSCSSGVLVNAAGAWVNAVAARIQPPPSTAAVDLVQGTHLILEGRLEKGGYYLEAPADRRAVFLLPWKGRMLLGTTETVYYRRSCGLSPRWPARKPTCWRPCSTISRIDRKRSWTVFAGLRVLPAAGSTVFARSRETRFETDNPRRPRVVAIYGGKLTGYRATAQRVMRLLHRTLPSRKPVASTSQLGLKPV